jgi:hypothetical protein
MDSREIKLPDENWKIVDRKARALGISQSDVINWMVQEFSPSTPQEIETQTKRWREDLLAYLRDNPNATTQEAWRAGRKAGWLHFQIRKSTHPFKLEE